MTFRFQHCTVRQPTKVRCKFGNFFDLMAGRDWPAFFVFVDKNERITDYENEWGRLYFDRFVRVEE